MKFGAERKKILILAALLAVAGVVFMINSTDGGGASPTSSAARPQSATPGGLTAPQDRESAARPSRASGRATTEFRPSLRPKRGEERTDPTTIDPTLRLDILAKLKQVSIAGAHRSIFDFGQAPPPKPNPAEAAKSKTPAPSPLVAEAKPAEPEKPLEPEKPKAPPIPLKFYGYISRTNNPAKRAFFMEGEEIHVAAEGELVKKRYKIVRIGLNSAVVEDTQFGQQQTLPLEEQPG
jgi:hypothetical protein